ncbi:ribosome silencing factor [Halomonas sp. 18H]|uniref:ribosome silencing factor n=1 Tax=Halomonas almeriensis TaxID=308163 RepID=UPI00222FCFA5|nr:MULTISPECIES: ribosome silencing factor [Halomonas]MCW4151084.1 ribosome silencing factor [Halomonas sp. 18H]MDN3552964.1 ribosome silencing factor [Halomonas almeriensis]
MHSDALKTLVIDSLEELKAQDIVQLDVSRMTSVTELMVVASGTSIRHLAALADNLIKTAKDEGFPPLGVEGESGTEWVLVDLGDVVVHLMMPETRALYDLERLWADLPTDGLPRREEEVSGSS